MIQIPVYRYIDERGNLWTDTVVETDIPVAYQPLAQAFVTRMEMELMIDRPLADRFRKLRELSTKQWTDVYMQLMAGKSLDDVQLS